MNSTPLDGDDNRRAMRAAGVIGLAIVALLLRLSFASFASADYTVFLSPWYDHLATSGIHGFETEFANYNFPYLFLLYLSTWLPVEKIVAVKLVSICFDFVLAASVYLLVLEIGRHRTRAILAAAVSLFLPTVVMNSSVWAQSDAIYVSFVLLSLWFAMRAQLGWSWMMFGVALAFKLQAVFFFPLLAYTWMRRTGPWYAPLMAIPAFVLLSIVPVAFGRSLRSALGVYLQQYGGDNRVLTVSAPNLYYMVPQRVVDLFNGPTLAVALAVVVVGLLFFFCVRWVQPGPTNLVFVAALFLLLAPFLLPQMHERYFYGFEVLCLVIAMVDARKSWVVGVSQFVAFCSYSWYLFDLKILPWRALSAIMLVVLLCFLYWIVQRSTFRSKI